LGSANLFCRNAHPCYSIKNLGLDVGTKTDCLPGCLNIWTRKSWNIKWEGGQLQYRNQTTPPFITNHHDYSIIYQVNYLYQKKSSQTHQGIINLNPDNKLINALSIWVLRIQNKFVRIRLFNIFFRIRIFPNKFWPNS
jgi:hypothetical protein